jgi:hypothetical protein
LVVVRGEGLLVAEEERRHGVNRGVFGRQGA